jgi:tripartite-type tricarboxylate transporter receptor subunit TctC
MTPRLRGIVFTLGCVIAGASGAQSYPTKPVRLIVPLAPGGPVDTVTRILAQGLSERLGQQIVVDNRPGAGGSVGADLVARAAPDGYSLLVGANGTLAVSPNLMKLPFDIARDFAPITLIGTSPQVLVVHPSLPARSVKDLIALAGSRPGLINFASSGQGSTAHLASELFKSMAKIDIVHIPYKGAGPALTDLAGGQTQMMITGISTTLPYIKAGRLRPLGVTSSRRVAVLPDVPPIAEAVAGYEVTTWYALLATAGTPPAVIARLNTEATRTLESEAVKTRMAGAGVDVQASTPGELAAMIRDETAKWGKVIRTVGIKAR